MTLPQLIPTHSEEPLPGISNEIVWERPVTVERLYLDLMKQCLTHILWGETLHPLRAADFRSLLPRKLFPFFARLISRTNIRLMREVEFDSVARTNGLDHPQRADTMIGLKRL